MKNSIYTLFLVLIIVSCGKEKTISEELVGEWFYERETFNSTSTFEDPDTEGFMTFREDETGNWDSSNGFFNFNVEWDLQASDTKIAITKEVIGLSNSFLSTVVYDLKREDEDSFTFTFHFKVDAPVDTLESFEQFENIILTRVE